MTKQLLQAISVMSVARQNKQRSENKSSINIDIKKQTYTQNVYVWVSKVVLTMMYSMIVI